MHGTHDCDKREDSEAWIEYGVKRNKGGREVERHSVLKHAVLMRVILVGNIHAALAYNLVVDRNLMIAIIYVTNSLQRRNEKRPKDKPSEVIS